MSASPARGRQGDLLRMVGVRGPFEKGLSMGEAKENGSNIEVPANS